MFGGTKMDIEKLKKANELKRAISIIKDDIKVWVNSYLHGHHFDHFGYADENIYQAFRSSVINDLKIKLIEYEKEFKEL